MLAYLSCALLVALTASSCKKCQTCECWKNGVMTIEDECARSTDHDDYFRYWGNSLVEEKDYDYCDCSYD